MSPITIFRPGWHYAAKRAAFLAVFAFALAGSASGADPIGASMQYPVIDVQPDGFLVKRHRGLTLAGAKNEHLLLHCRFPAADPATFKICLAEKRPKPASPKITCTFSQVYWAPPACRGKFPADALLPLDQGLLAVGDAVDILVTLYIPPDFPAGSFPFELNASDQIHSYRQPVKVQVYNFSLPDDLPIAIFGGFWDYPPDFYAKYGVNSFENYLEVIKSFYRSMRQYKINTLGGFYSFPFEEIKPGQKIEEFTAYHSLLQYALAHLNYRFFMIPKMRGWRTINQPGDSFIKRAQVFYPLYQDYLKRYGWQHRALNYLIDEPSPDLYPAARQAFAAAKQLAPDIRTLCAGWNPDPAFVEVIDIWATPASYYKEPQAQSARSRGQEQWLYANRLHAIDHPAVHQRLIGWILYRHKFNGYLLWGVNYWPHDPWTAEPGDADFWRRGTFYYPHPLNGLPVPTLRLASFRRGLQDYQYFRLLKEAQEKGLVPLKRAEQIEQKLEAITNNFQSSSFQVPMQELENLRLQVGQLLHRAAGKSPSPKTKAAPDSAKLPEAEGFLRGIWRSLVNPE
ncbi:MAG: DUF4091 domain-containing protein [Deltaproteobacteria bacterium]|nr:DUF4091 domain-containing protein [Deltaproteobacteria bacterium]